VRRALLRPLLLRDRPTSSTRTSPTGPAGSPAHAARPRDGRARRPLRRARALPARPLSRRVRPAREQARLPRLRLRPARLAGAPASRRAVHVRLHRHAHPREGDPRPHPTPSARCGASCAFASGVAPRAGHRRAPALAARSRRTRRPGRVAPEYRTRRSSATSSTTCDAIVVPSVWVENSPLVIHEAQQARVPVITADVGGMAEYVHHEVNGLLFEHRSMAALAEQMQRLVDEPGSPHGSASRGYLFSATGDIPASRARRRAIEAIYERAPPPDSARVGSRRRALAHHVRHQPRHLQPACVMCEEHSPHSPLQLRAEGGREAASPDADRDDRARDRRGRAEHGLREVIPSTMGEPLLYEHFDGSSSSAATHGVKLNLTTNGTFPRLGAGLGRADRPGHLGREDLVERRDRPRPTRRSCSAAAGSGAGERPRLHRGA
jgi:hypothetical protein